MRKLLVIPVAGLALLVYAGIWHPWGVLYAFGVHPYPQASATPWTYQLWSGIIPALTILTLFGSLGGAYHLHNCHQDGCWRIGKHRIAGAPWCSRHEALAKPDISAEDLLTQILEQLRSRG